MKGRAWQFAAENNYVNGQLYQDLGRLRLGLRTPLRHSSIWLRSSGGTAFGDRLSPYANFYFGGYGITGWITVQKKEYREYYSFPGVALNEISGKNYAKSVLEWNLPPVRFRRVGRPAFT